MGEVQSCARDAGYMGLWSEALATEAGSGSGGVAVLANTSICITAPPGRDSCVLEPGRGCPAPGHR